MRTAASFALALICLASPLSLVAAAGDRCFVEAIGLVDGSTFLNSTCDISTPCGSACANHNSLVALTAQVSTLEAEKQKLAALATQVTADNVILRNADTANQDSLTALTDRVSVLEDEKLKLTKLTARVSDLEDENAELRNVSDYASDEIAALKALVKESLGGFLLETPKLSASAFTLCGVAKNPTSWQLNDVGMLGTYAARKDNDNWSVDCRLSVKAAIDAGATDIIMRIYDPVDSTHMDFEYTVSASNWYNAFQNYDIANNVMSLSPLSKPTSFGGFFSHKIWSVGSSANQGNIYSRVLTKPSYIQHYCNGADDGADLKYSGSGTKTAFNFIVGGGGTAHATLCSTGLGVYGPSACTTGTSYNCYIGGDICNDNRKTACRSDAAQRAAVSIKLGLSGPPKLSASAFTLCGVAKNPTSWQLNDVGMLGTYAARKDNDNWSVDCRLSVKAAIDAGATDIIMRIYDPVDSTHMDFEYTVPASEWYDAFQNFDSAKDEATLQTSSRPTSFGGFFSHKIWSVGSSANQGNIYSRVLSKPSYIQNYCNGGADFKYSGSGTKTAFNFIVGGGGTAHAALCSTGLGVYGPSQCTTGTSYNCYIGGNTCNDAGKTACRSDAAQRAAMSIKLA